MSEVEVVLPARARLGEGPVWDAGRAELVWVDIARRQLHRTAPSTGQDRVATFPEPVTAVAPVARGGLVVAIGHGVALLPEEGAPLQPLARLPTGDRANDGRCDPAGRFLVGTMSPAAPGASALYRLARSAGAWSAEVVLPGATISNGLDWSPDGTALYYVDTPTRRIDVVAYDVRTGAVGERRAFVDLAGEQGRPDGLVVDGEGGVWVALIRGGEVRRYSADGALERSYRLPTRWPTSMAFGGDDLGDLYVTSAHDPDDRRPDAQLPDPYPDPLAGALFRLRPGVTGRPAAAWRDGG